ncbi:hypothetical protein ACFWFB_27575 [Streptomyces albidoflavus]
MNAHATGSTGDVHIDAEHFEVHDLGDTWAGGGWVFTMTLDGDGTRIDVELTRQPTTLKGKRVASLLPLVAPSSPRKLLAGPLRAK